jgi:hypothetical protein
MRLLRQKCGAGCHRLQNARFAYFAQIRRDPIALGYQAYQALGHMDIEVIQYDTPARNVGIGVHRAADMGGKVGFRARGATRNLLDNSGDDIEIDDESAGSMPNILMFPASDLPHTQRQTRMLALQSLNAGHFVGRNRFLTVIGTFWR